MYKGWEEEVPYQTPYLIRSTGASCRVVTLQDYFFTCINAFIVVALLDYYRSYQEPASYAGTAAAVILMGVHACYAVRTFFTISFILGIVSMAIPHLSMQAIVYFGWLPEANVLKNGLYYYRHVIPVFLVTAPIALYLTDFCHLKRRNTFIFNWWLHDIEEGIRYARRVKEHRQESRELRLRKKKGVVEEEVSPFERLVGQDSALKPLRQIAMLAKTGVRIGDKKEPRAVVLMMGPTGTGKTEAAKALAEDVYGTKKALIRFDMGQFTDKASAARFYGASPGYVGSDEPGQLCQAVKETPNAVLLLDEVEKAHPEIWDAFLSIFDEGYIKDAASGSTYDMTGITIVLTSNLFAGDPGIQVLESSELKNRIAKTGKFRPELLARINEICIFEPLSGAAIAEILKRKVVALKEQMKEQGLEVELGAKQQEELIEQLKEAPYGVREIDDRLKQLVRSEISDKYEVTRV